MSQVGLMKHISVDRTTMVHLIDDLERLGLVERAQNPKDRRSNVIRLLPPGETVLAEGKKRMSASEADFLSCLSSEEQAQLRVLLFKVAGDEG
jgi:DNA-binding MarR family transcriptional regulator